jgi:hypothetical protein
MSRYCPSETEIMGMIQGGWIAGKPVTKLMRQLLQDLQDDALLVSDDTREFYAALILARWKWVSLDREDRKVRVSLTDIGQEALSSDP